MEEEFLKAFLDKAVDDSKKEIQEKGTLSQTNAISLLMKIMFNHVTELQKDMIDIKANMATKDDIEALKKETKDDIGSIKEDIKNIQHWVMFAVALLAIFIPTAMTIIMWVMNK